MAFEGAEQGLFRALNGAGSNPLLDSVAVLLDISAALYVIILWTAPLWVVRRRALAFDFLLAIIVTVAVTEALKFAIGRSRPEDVYGLANVHILRPPLFPDFTDPSFPSGHTSRAFVLATLLGLQRRKWLPFLVPYAFVAGLARVYEGVHYPSDILGGAIVGLAIGVAFWKLDTWPPYIRLREKLIGRWLSPAPGGRGGSRSPSGPGPT
jgi:membrane-associated phospholipid phosphatase